MKLKSLLREIDENTNIILSLENGAVIVKKNEIGKRYKSFNVNNITVLNNSIKVKISL